MTTLLLIFYVLWLPSLAFFVMLFIRNNWVYRNRLRLLRTPDYDRLPSYETMLWRWWVWDVRRFL